MEASSTTLSEAAEATAETIGRTADRLWEELEVTERWVRKIARDYPLTCFLGAVAGGYLIARIARRA
jgi:hypothetical protein